MVVQVWYKISTQFDVLWSLSTPKRRTDFRHPQALYVTSVTLIPEWRFGFSGNNFCCFRLSEDFRVKIAVVPDTVFLQLKVRYQILLEESILSFLELLRAFLPCCNTNILFKIQAGCLVGKSTQSMKNFDRGTSLPLPRVKPNVICTALSHTTQHGLSQGLEGHYSISIFQSGNMVPAFKWQ